MAYIQLKEVDYYYPGEKEKCVNNINLDIESGEILFLVGKSGSGKTTLGKIITGAVPHFYGGMIKGDIKIDGRDIKELSHSDRASELTMVFQDPEKQLMMNKVYREIAFGLENTGVEENVIEKRTWEAMQFSNILDLAFRDISTLSGGQKQKVAVASAIAYLPKCIILDEPTSQLDPSASEELVNLIKKINDELGITIIIIEQRIDKWFDIADRIAVMDKGNLVFCGNKEELYKDGYRQFLPEYLKLAYNLNLDSMPCSMKKMRERLKDTTFMVKAINYENKAEEDDFIKIKKMSSSYGAIKALDNINLCVKKGDFLGVIGANGAGKSTLLKTIMGLSKYEGSIKVFNGEVKKLKLKDISGSIGYVSQNPNDYISKDTVFDELKFTLDNYGITDYSRVETTLKKLDIYELKDKNPRDLSGGEKQRVAIGSILVTKPKILLLDEPTRGLDYNVKKKLGELLKQLNKEGTTIILVTHDMEFVSQFCRRFILMFNGRVMADGDHMAVMGNGIYFTTSSHKLVRQVDKSVFNIDQIVRMNCV